LDALQWHEQGVSQEATPLTREALLKLAEHAFNLGLEWVTCLSVRGERSPLHFSPALGIA
jgi:hypothetical protein